MSESALERAFRERVIWLRDELPRHDRAVILGMILCLVPVPPLAASGLVISIVNYRLLQHGRISRRDAPLIRIAICCGVLTTVATTILAFTIVRGVVHSMAMLATLPDALLLFLDHVLHLPWALHGATQAGAGRAITL